MLFIFFKINKDALFESIGHFDDNDVQTISHLCHVLPYKEYLAKKKKIKNSLEYDEDDVYYLSGIYDEQKKSLQIKKDVPMRN